MPRPDPPYTEFSAEQSPSGARNTPSEDLQHTYDLSPTTYPVFGDVPSFDCSALENQHSRGRPHLDARLDAAYSPVPRRDALLGCAFAPNRRLEVRVTVIHTAHRARRGMVLVSRFGFDARLQPHELRLGGRGVRKQP